MLWSFAMFSLAVYAVVIAIGDYVSLKTKGVVVNLLFACIVYTIGYLTGIIPPTSPGDTNLLAVMGSVGTMLVVTNLGTMMDIKKFLQEWKTVALCLIALVVLGITFVTVGAMVFSREEALMAYPPIAGGIVAAILVGEVATTAGYPELAAFASMLCAIQTFVGVPIAAISLSRFTKRYVKTEAFRSGATAQAAEKNINLRILPEMPASLNSPNMIIAKLIIVAFLGIFVAKLTNNVLPAAVLTMVFGVLFTEIGFLDRNALQKAGMFNFIMFALCMTLPSSFSTLTPDSLKGMILPVVFFLGLGAVALYLGGGLIGKLVFKLDFALAGAVSMSAMYGGFPCSMIITQEVVRGMNLPAEDAKRLEEYILPKMVIAGFTTVTIASVVIAGIIAPYIFK